MKEPALSLREAARRLIQECPADERAEERFKEFCRQVPAANLIGSDEHMLTFLRRWMTAPDGLEGEIARERLLAEIRKAFPSRPQDYLTKAAIVKHTAAQLEQVAAQVMPTPFTHTPIAYMAEVVRSAFDDCRVLHDAALPQPPPESEISLSRARATLLDLADWLSLRATELDAENPPADAGNLSDRQKEILRVLLDLESFDSDSRRKADEIARHSADSEANPEGFKKPISGLVASKLVCSKTGAGGGCWLTPEGRALANRLKAKRAARPE